jgi:hypothetical protein
MEKAGGLLYVNLWWMQIRQIRPLSSISFRQISVIKSCTRKLLVETAFTRKKKGFNVLLYHNNF